MILTKVPKIRLEEGDSIPGVFAGLFTFWLIEVGLCWVSCVLWVTQISGAATVGERTNGRV